MHRKRRGIHALSMNWRTFSLLGGCSWASSAPDSPHPLCSAAAAGHTSIQRVATQGSLPEHDSPLTEVLTMSMGWQCTLQSTLPSHSCKTKQLDSFCGPQPGVQKPPPVLVVVAPKSWPTCPDGGQCRPHRPQSLGMMDMCKPVSLTPGQT